MSKIIETKITPDLKYTVKILAEKAEYEDFKERLVAQFIKNIEVKGFRKGHAPKDLALAQVNQLKLQTTILEETVQKFYTELMPDIKEDLKKLKREVVFSSAELSTDEQSTKETDQGFEFTISISLLADVDLSVFEKLQIKIPTEKDLDDRPSFKEFKDKEHQSLITTFGKYKTVSTKAKKDSRIFADITEQPADGKGEAKESKNAQITLGQNLFPPEFEENLIGAKAKDVKKFELNLETPTHDGGTKALKYKFVVTVLEVQEIESKDLEEIIKNSEEAKKQIKSADNLEKMLKDIYERQTEELIVMKKRRDVVEGIVTKVKDFDLPKQLVTSETERIMNVLQSRSLERKISLSEAFAQAGLPGSEKKVKNDNQVLELVTDYVNKEFKLVEILRATYYAKVEPKITPQEMAEIQADMQKNPAKYNLRIEDVTGEKAADVAFDRLLREKSYQWIASQIKFI